MFFACSGKVPGHILSEIILGGKSVLKERIMLDKNQAVN
jgi:hypothetical protein